MLSLQAWRPGWLPVPAPTHPHNSHPLTIRSKGLKKLIKRIVKQEAAEQEAERRSVAAVQSGPNPNRNPIRKLTPGPKPEQVHRAAGGRRARRQPLQAPQRPHAGPTR